MSRYRPHRSTSLAITFFGAVVNVVLTIQVISVCRSLKWESDSEWEGSQRVDGVKLVSGLLCLYFTAASLVSLIGFTGVAKVRPSVRIVRNPPPSSAQFPLSGKGRLSPVLPRFVHCRFRIHLILHRPRRLWRIPASHPSHGLRRAQQTARVYA